MNSKTPRTAQKKTATTTSTTTDDVLSLLHGVEAAGYQPIEICVGDVRVVMQPMPPKSTGAATDRQARPEPEDIYDEFGADDPEYQALKKRGSKED